MNSDYNSDSYSLFKHNALETKKEFSREEENNLFAKYKKTEFESDRDYILSCFSYLICEIIDSQFNNTHCDKEDLFQDGMLGLLGAIKSYNPQGNRFSTYAKKRIEFSIKTSLLSNTQSGAKMPKENIDLFTKTKKIKEELFADLEREPSYEEISQKLNNEYTPDEIRLNENVFLNTFSLDETLEDGETTREEVFAVEQEEDSPESIFNKADLNGMVDEIMDDPNVPEIDKRVLKERLNGFIDNETVLDDYRKLAQKYELPFLTIRSVDRKNIERLKNKRAKNQRGDNKWKM